MSVLVNRNGDADVHKDAYQKAQRTTRINEEVRISLELVHREAELPNNSEENFVKLSPSKLVKNHGIKTNEFITKLLLNGFFELLDGSNYPSNREISVSGEYIEKSRYVPYFL